MKNKKVNIRKLHKKNKIDRTKKSEFQTVKITPSQNWFGNIRLMPQADLQYYQSKYTENVTDPFKIVITSKKLPTAILSAPKTSSRLNFKPEYDVQVGEKSKRNPLTSLKVSSFQEFISLTKGNDKENKNERKTESDTKIDFNSLDSINKFTKLGRSDRIRKEVLKLIDSSDILFEVLDARDPLGTRLYSYEALLKKSFKTKKIIFILNKVDLVPNNVAREWMRKLSKEFPTLAFSSANKRYNFTQDFGVSAVVKLLRQIKGLLASKGRTWMTVGVIGYPNVGKSSFINSMKGKKTCMAAPKAGETKVNRYVNLFNDIYLIDCPGVVSPTALDTKGDLVLRGVCRIETVEEPRIYIDKILKEIDNGFLKNLYGIGKEWESAEEFLEELGRVRGKLKKGGVVDKNKVARNVINDWVRGKLPWYVKP